jgi:hypothetical protein
MNSVEEHLKKVFYSGCGKLVDSLDKHYMCPACQESKVYEKRANIIDHINHRKNTIQEEVITHATRNTKE